MLYNQIMSNLNELLELVKYPNKDKINLIARAYYYAEAAHRGQKRYSGEDYFTHSVETAKILAQLGMGRRTISAGLLHDVLEDGGISEEELGREFGKEILFLVQGVTKLGEIRLTTEQRHIESLRKFFVAMSKDIRVLIIKLADRLHNMRTLEYIPKEKQQRIALETMQIYVPLAYRLGMRQIKREMEDLAFKYIDPKLYKKLGELLKERRKNKEKQLDKFRKLLLKRLGQEDTKNVVTDTRLKSLYSVHRKMEARGKNIDQIYDISALRVNVDTIAECYKVLGVIHTICKPLPGRIKDYIASPKTNGYQSLHTTVLTSDGEIIEIQIRTHEMHEQAEFGFASHIKYKEGNKESSTLAWFKQFFYKPKENEKRTPNPERAKHIPHWILQLVDVQSYISIPTEFIDNLKTDFFEHRMFIFNPKGEVVDLPIGSTPIDVAYEHDTDAGNHLFGAKVNNKLAPIGAKLKNGDVVEIITKPSSHPREKWLKQCKTSYAKKCITEALNKDEPVRQKS